MHVFATKMSIAGRVCFGNRNNILRCLNFQFSLTQRRRIVEGSGWGTQSNVPEGGKEENLTKEVRRPLRPKKSRAETLDLNQTDWSSIYETASPYNTHVIPLEIRMGRVNPMKVTGRLGYVPREAKGNVELLKIPNFFHITPPAIDKHCEVLKEYCTPWPMHVKHHPVRITTINYLYSGPSIRHPDSKKVKLQVYLKDLKLSTRASRKFKLLVGDRYNPNNDEFTLITDKCPTRKQNKEYAYYLLTALCAESNKKQAWEKEAESKSEEDINEEVEMIRAELNPKYSKEKAQRRRYYRVVNEKLIRYNSYGHPFVYEMRKFGVKGGLNEKEMEDAKMEWKKIQTCIPDNTTFDPPYYSSYASEFSMH